MTDGNTLIVDVVSSGDGYMLNDTPVNMMIAYEVVRRHVTDNGTFYSQMTMKQKTAEGYVFKFDTGDVFESTSDTAYPTSATLNDAKPAELPAVTASDAGKFLHTNESTGALEWAEGGSGGVLVVHDVEGTLDKTWQKIHDTPVAVILDSTGKRLFVSDTIINVSSKYVVSAGYRGEISTYVAQSASGYPTYTDK